MSGGLNLSTEPDLVPLDDFPHLLNWDVRERGVLKTRGGSVKVNATKISTNALTSIIPYDFFDGTNWQQGVIVSDGATLWKVTTAGTVSSIGTGYVAGSTWTGCCYAGKIYLCNGLNAPLVWNGTTLRQMGVQRPTFTPTEVHSAAGTLSAVTGYQYKVTYYDSTNGIESAEGTVAVASTGAFTSKKVVVSGLTASGQAHVDKIKIYRTMDGGTEFYYLVTQNDGTATYDDQTADASLGSGMDVDDHDPPPSARYMVAWENRLWMGGISTGTADLSGYAQCIRGEVYYSQAGDVEYVPYQYQGTGLGHRFSLKSDDGDVRLLVPAGSALIVGSKKRLYRVLSEASDNWTVQEVAANVGCYGRNAFAQVGPLVFFFGSTPIGVYAFDGYRLETVSDLKLGDGFNPLPDDTAVWNSEYHESASLAYNKPANQVWLSLATNGASYKDRVLVLQLGTAARWTQYDHQVTKLASARGVHEATDKDFIYGIDRFGFLWRYDAGTADGVPSGTQSGTATSGGASTLTQSTAAFYTTGNGLAGVRVTITGGTGSGQTRFISSNTATQLTVEAAWDTNPAAGSTYEIGAIRTELKTRHFDFASERTNPRQTKNFRAVRVDIDHGDYTGADTMTVNTYVDTET